MKAALLTLAMLASGAVHASEPAATAQNPNSAAAAGTSETIGEGTNKVICKREKVSGSRTASKRICQTAAEWERQRRTDQQAVEKVQGARWKGN